MWRPAVTSRRAELPSAISSDSRPPSKPEHHSGFLSGRDPGCRLDKRDANQNLVQTYTVTKVTWHSKTVLGTGIVPPNNQGIATPFYNQGDDGENPAKDGVSTFAQLDRYTQQAITEFTGKGEGYIAFAGQRDDGFYADINSIFDLLNLRVRARVRIHRAVSTFT